MVVTMNSDSKRRTYVEIKALMPSEVDDILHRGNPLELRYAAISVSMFSDDYEWALSICLQLTKNTDSIVRGNAIQSLGHLARRFRKLDLNVVEPIYRSALQERDEYIRSQAEDMLDDIRYYLVLDSKWPLAD